MSERPTSRRNYYEVLGLVDTATPEEVDAAFRRLARKWHPDAHPDLPRPAADFKLVAEAYEVLGDPEKRRRYDESRSRRRRGEAAPAIRPRRRGAPDIGAGFGTGPALDVFGEFHALFESLWRGGWTETPAATSASRPELTVSGELPLTPEEALRGGVVQFHLRFDQGCPECGGRGRRGEAACAACGGNGRIAQGPRPVTIRVPPGVQSGSVIRVRGEGRLPPGPGPPGDLLLRVRVHPCW